MTYLPDFRTCTALFLGLFLIACNKAPQESAVAVSSDSAAVDAPVARIDTVEDKEQDVVGRVYEYFLGKFAASEGK